MLVHERVKQLIADHGLNQSALARQMDEDPDWLNNRVIGRVQIKADEVAKIATVLKVDPCWLLLGEEATTETLKGTQPRGIRFATRWAGLIDQVIPEDDADAEQLEIALLRKMLEVKERRLSQKG